MLCVKRETGMKVCGKEKENNVLFLRGGRTYCTIMDNDNNNDEDTGQQCLRVSRMSLKLNDRRDGSNTQCCLL